MRRSNAAVRLALGEKEAKTLAAKKVALKKKEITKSIRETDEWVQLIYLKDKLSKDKIQDYRALLEVQKLIDIYGGSVFYLPQKDHNRIGARSKSPILLIKENNNGMREDFKDCLKRLDVLERPILSYTKPNAYSTYTMDRNTGTQMEEPASYVEKFEIRRQSPKPKSRGYRSTRATTEASSVIGQPSIGKSRVPRHTSSGSRSVGQRREATDSSRSQSAKMASSRKRVSPLAGDAPAGSRMRSGVKASDRKRAESRLATGGQSRRQKSRHETDKIVKKNKKIRIDKENRSKVKDGGSNVKPKTKKEKKSSKKNKIIEKEEVKTFEITLSAEQNKNSSAKLESKNDIVEKGKEHRKLQTELSGIKLQGHQSDFYIVAENVKYNTDKVQVETEIKKVLQKNSNFRPGEAGNKIGKAGRSQVDKCIQVNEAPSQVQYPQIRYPTGYGPSEEMRNEISSTPLPMEHEEYDTWLRDKPAQEEKRDTSGYSTTLPVVTSEKERPKSLIKKGKSAKSQKVSFRQSREPSRKSTRRDEDSVADDASSYQSSDPLAGYESDTSDLSNMSDHPHHRGTHHHEAFVLFGVSEKKAHLQKPFSDRDLPIQKIESQASDQHQASKEMILTDSSKNVRKNQEAKQLEAIPEVKESKLEVENPVKESMDPITSQLSSVESPSQQVELKIPLIQRTESIHTDNQETKIEEDELPRKEVNIPQEEIQIEVENQKVTSDSIDIIAENDSSNQNNQNQSKIILEEIEKKSADEEPIPKVSTPPINTENKYVLSEPTVTTNHIKDLLKNSPFGKKPAELSNKMSSVGGLNKPIASDNEKKLGTQVVNNTGSQTIQKPDPMQTINQEKGIKKNGENIMAASRDVTTELKKPDEVPKPRPLSESLKDNPFLKKEKQPEVKIEPQEAKSAIKENPFVKKESAMKEAKPVTDLIKEASNQPQQKLASNLKENPFVKLSEDARKKEELAKQREETAKIKANPEIMSIVAGLKGLWK